VKPFIAKQRELIDIPKMTNKMKNRQYKLDILMQNKNKISVSEKIKQRTKGRIRQD